MQVDDKNHRVELDQICMMKMAKCFLNSENGNTESFSLVTPSYFGLADKKRSVRPSSIQRNFLSSQLTRQLGSQKYLQGIN